MLDEKETLSLIRLAKQGSGEAKERLIAENTRLLKSILRRYLNKGVEYDDLYELAVIGFLKAIGGFDEKFGVRFSTYAVPMIAGEIKRFLRDDGSIKVSRVIKQTAREMNAFIEEYSYAEGRQPTIAEIAEKFHMEEGEVVFTLGSTHRPLSLYERSDYKDEKADELCERIPAKESADDVIENIAIRSAMEKLSEREKKIVFLRYFRDMTQSEVARTIGVSQVQVSRIESKLMEVFRRELSPEK